MCTSELRLYNIIYCYWYHMYSMTCSDVQLCVETDVNPAELCHLHGNCYSISITKQRDSCVKFHSVCGEYLILF